MKNLFPILFLLFFLNLDAQEVPIWKEMNKEFDDCGSSLKLYDDHTFFYEKFCEGMRFSFCMGSWEKRNELIHLNPRIKESFTLQILEKKKSDYNTITVLDINGNPIPNFDFIQFSKNVTPVEAVMDMDDYVSFTGKTNMTEISTPIISYDDGHIKPDLTNRKDKFLAYDLYQISGDKIVFDVKDLMNSVHTFRINLPAEIFQYSDLNYIELPSHFIELEGEGYKFVSKSE